MATLPTTSEKINHFKDNIDISCDQIKTMLDMNGVGLSAFTLTCCLIDAVASYTIDEKENNQRYKIFIDRYLAKVNEKYSTTAIKRKIYESVRCSLVHSFTVANGVLLSELKAQKKLHLSTEINNCLVLDLRSFYDEVEASIKILFKELDKNVNMQKILKKRYTKYPCFEVYKFLQYPGETATGKTTTNLRQINLISYGRRKIY